MAVGRKIEDESEAQRCLSAAQRSGLSAGEWARAHGVDGRSLHAWQMNLERRSSDGPRPKRRNAKPKRVRAAHALVELVPATPSAGGRGRYLIEVAGARIEFGDDVSVTTLRRVLEAVRSC